MFCGNCGNKLPDDARFCGECGAVVAQTAPQPEVPVKEEGFFKKDMYFLKRAEPKSRMLYFISWALVLASLLSILFSGVVALNGDMLNRPFGRFVNLATDGDMAELRDKFVDEVDRIKDAAEDSGYDEHELVRAVDKLGRRFSIHNFRKCMKIYKAAYEEMGYDDLVEEIQIVDGVLTGMVTVIVCGLLAAAVLTALAAVFKKFPFAIAGIAVAVGFIAVFSGFLWVLLSVASHVGMIIVYIKLNKEYKENA